MTNDTPPTSGAEPQRTAPGGMVGDPGPLLRIVKDQRLAFLVVGGANTGIGFLIFVGFQFLVGDPLGRATSEPVGYMTTLGLSHVTSVVIAFVLYRTLVFRVRGHVWRDLARFESVYLVSIGVNAVLLPLLVEVAGLPVLFAQFLIVFVTTMISYFGHRYFSFRRRPEEH